MNVIREELHPLQDKIIISDMNFGLETSTGGIVLLSDDGKTSGIHPRWAKVFAVGPEQTDVTVGDWILLEHGRWSRGIKYETKNGEHIDIRLADKDAILAISNEKPTDALLAQD
jgi:co-chaperonin GroES (HSP10)